MSEAAAVRPSPTGRREGYTRTLTRPFDGERLALGATAVAVAMLPLLVPGGPSNSAPEDLLIVIAIGAAMFWASLSGHKLRFPFVVPMALFLVGGAVGALRGPVPRTGGLALFQDLLLLLWCWAIVNIASSPRRLDIVIRSWAYSAVAWATLLLLGVGTGNRTLTGQSGAEGVRTALTFVDPNIAANYFFISFMVVWASQRPRKRNRRLVAYAVLLAAMFTTGSSGGLTSLALGAGVAGLFTVYRKRGATAAISAAAFGAVAIFALHSMVSVSSIQSAAANSRWAYIRDGLGRGEQSAESRQAIFRESTALFDATGGFGAGPVSTKPRLRNEQAPVVKEAHDDYVAALLERGVVGFAGLLLLFGVLLVRSASYSTGKLASDYERIVPNPQALAGAVVGVFFAASVYEVLHMRHVWTLFALVAAISVFGRDK